MHTILNGTYNKGCPGVAGRRKYATNGDIQTNSHKYTKTSKAGHTIHGQKRRFVRKKNTPVLTKWKNGLKICAFLQETQKEMPEKVDLLSKYSKSD